MKLAKHICSVFLSSGNYFLYAHSASAWQSMYTSECNQHTALHCTICTENIHDLLTLYKTRTCMPWLLRYMQPMYMHVCSQVSPYTCVAVYVTTIIIWYVRTHNYCTCCTYMRYTHVHAVHTCGTHMYMRYIHV